MFSWNGIITGRHRSTLSSLHAHLVVHGHPRYLLNQWLIHGKNDVKQPKLSFLSYAEFFSLKISIFLTLCVWHDKRVKEGKKPQFIYFLGGGGRYLKNCFFWPIILKIINIVSCIFLIKPQDLLSDIKHF